MGADAWKLLFPSIPSKLAEFHQNGFKIVYEWLAILLIPSDFVIFLTTFFPQVVFTNEANITIYKNARQKAVDSKIGRLEAFREKVQLPVQVIICKNALSINFA